MLVKKYEDDRYIDYRFLSVTLKDDHTDYNMPGGKMDPDEKRLTATAVRELEEETGIKLRESDLALLHTDLECSDGDYMVVTYYHIIDGNNTSGAYNVSTEENHKVEWIPLRRLTESKTWPEYNTKVYHEINNVLQNHDV